ncbi:zinc-ribbon and DUF3426 domain-containing protein [Sediminicurvatus halobius]|uniref:Zinc finger/thioredoxin putative domain-containing protein n=1 Tax=Sediminicurvatus halobius TaxID=2182432 RepID=A0A2U2MXF1_9GAMM|nr:zinc-ribbon and DUF3426 domain-containing protein [Spiribacter halobius]PWG61551.1 hypothetical protein DEM34_15720 [Spiribacter halobius]UEX77120.1 zinc-ribbon and DUF3426 domain-containing protein [Spiribacter halobius]
MSYTQCPSCLTLFRVDVRHLRQAGGVVRCGLCSESFNALASLCDRLPGDLPVVGDAADGASAPAGPAPRETAPADTEPPAQTPAATDTAGVSGTSEATGTAAAASARAPEDVREAPTGLAPDWGEATRLEVETPAPVPARRRGRWLLWSLLSLLLAAGASGLWLWPEREQLLQDPQWRPWLAEICALAGCELPLLERPQVVAVLERELAALPDGGGTLRFTATVSNRASEAIAWPELVIHLLDPAGRTVAEHRVPASGYLAEAPAGGGMPPGEPVQLAIELPDPGPGAASFEIRFR